MSYTNVETVRRFLSTASPAMDRICDQPVVIADSNPVRFFNGGVEGATVVVKAIRSQSPQRMAVTLGDEPVAMGTVPLVQGSVVVASDSSLGTVYIENVDYLVDYAGAKLILNDAGSLTAGQSVSVWLVPYVLLAAGQDYALDVSKAEIRRVGSEIAPGETVYLDYTPAHLDLEDELLYQAVATANRTVENEVDPEREFEADATLNSVAADRALEILCRAAATRMLSANYGADKAALAWLKLAGEFAARAESMLRSFRPPMDGPRGPVRS